MAMTARLLLALSIALLIAAGIYRFSSASANSSNRQAANASPPEEKPDIRIEHIAYRKAYDLDPGTIRAYLFNSTDREILVEKVLLDGAPLTVWGVDPMVQNAYGDEDADPGTSHDPSQGHGEEPTSLFEEAASQFADKRALWARLDPPTLAPGEVAEFSAKLVHALPRPMKLSFQTADGKILAGVVRPLPPTFRITGITFADSLDRLYIYMEGRSRNPLNIHSLSLNGKAMENDLWLSSSTLGSGEKLLAILDLQKPLTQGEYIVLRVECARGEVAEERVRVFAGFPLCAESGAGQPGLGLDNETYTRRPRWMGAADPSVDAPSSPPPPGLHGNYILACHMHNFGGNRERCALESLRRHAVCRQYDPHHPTFNHLCRIRPETGYALFAETADILRINPNIVTSETRGQPKETPEETVARVTKHAVLAARPRPVHSLEDTYIFGSQRVMSSPAEFRRKAFSILAQGVKGLFARHHHANNPNAEAMNEEMRKLNATIRLLRRDLAIAEPVDWASVENFSDISAYSLLAGDRGLIVILVRHEATGNAPEQNLPQTVSLQVRTPKWFSLGACRRAGAEGWEDVPIGRPKQSPAHIALPVPEIAEAYWIERAKP